MQNTAAMNSDVKALLTLLALKTGTTSPEIHHALQLAAASRVMMAEEHANPTRSQGVDHAASNVAKLRPNGNVPETSASVRRMKQSADAMNSDIKALITLMLLRNGADANEIQTALRMAAASRAAAAADEAEAMRIETAQTDNNPEMVAELANLAGVRQQGGNKEFAA